MIFQSYNSLSQALRVRKFERKPAGGYCTPPLQFCPQLAYFHLVRNGVVYLMCMLILENELIMVVLGKV